MEMQARAESAEAAAMEQAIEIQQLKEQLFTVFNDSVQDRRLDSLREEVIIHQAILSLKLSLKPSLKPSFKLSLKLSPWIG